MTGRRPSTDEAPRIAHVISTPEGIGGAERVVQSLVEGGAARGWDQIVLNPFASDPASAALREVVGHDRYRGARCRRWHQLPGLYRWLAGEICDFEPDLLHVHLFHAAIAVSSQPRWCREARVLSQHHGDQFDAQEEGRREWLDRLAGRRYDRVVCVSDATREFVATRYGYPPERLEVILNGWTGRPLPSRARPDQPTVICTANFRRQKGHDVLIAAFAMVKARIPAARLLLVGEGELGAEIRAEIAKRDLRESVCLAGATNDIWPLLAEAHVFALASRHEPLGISILEAMAASLPVVATDVGGIPELVRPGVTGELVPPGDVEALSYRLVELLESPARGRELGRAASVRASDLTSQAMVDRHFSLYDGLLARRRTHK
jgi:glycosyltransferase involved in cell wall biosynthesis